MPIGWPSLACKEILRAIQQQNHRGETKGTPRIKKPRVDHAAWKNDNLLVEKYM